MRNFLIIISSAIALGSIIFFTQDIKKEYHSTKLAVLVGSLKQGLNQTKSAQERQLLMNNAMPILFTEKNAFLSPVGYWPTIFNGYTQTATVENLNLNYPDSARLLLKAIHFHPFLANAFGGLARVLLKTGQRQEAEVCQAYAESIMNGTCGRHVEQRETCLASARKLLTKH